MKEEISLRVKEALVKDVGRAIARIDPKEMKVLALESGDVVIIEGKRATPVKIMPCFPEDRDKGIIQIDGITRENAQAGIDEKVKISRSVCKQAAKIKLKPDTKSGSLFKADDAKYIGSLINGLPVTKGDKVRASLFGSRTVEYTVTGTSPEGVVLINPNTAFQLELAKQDKARIDDKVARAADILALGSLLDLPTPATLTAPPELEVPAGDADALESEALRGRPDLLARRQAVAAGDAMLAEANWRWVPMLTANFTGRYTDTPGFIGKNWLWAATANLVIPLFDRGLRYAESDERNATSRRLQREVDKSERDLRSALAQTRAEIAVDRHTLEVAIGQAKKTKRTADIVARAQLAGAATSLEVAEADTNLRVAEASVERERINLNLAVLRLRHLTGNVRSE